MKLIKLYLKFLHFLFQVVVLCLKFNKLFSLFSVSDFRFLFVLVSFFWKLFLFVYENIEMIIFVSYLNFKVSLQLKNLLMLSLSHLSMCFFKPGELIIKLINMGKMIVTLFSIMHQLQVAINLRHRPMSFTCCKSKT